MILDLKSIFKAFVLLFKNNINVRRAVYGTLSFVIVLTLFVSVFSVTDLTYAVEVSVEGESCGYVTDRKTVDRAVNILHESSVENDVDYSTPTVDCVYTIVSSSQLISPDELADNIVSNDNSVNKVACVVINGIAFAKVDSVEDGVAALSGIAGNNRFYNLVEIRECVLSAEAKSRLKSLDERINDYIVTDVEYQTVEGDTKQSVAEKFGISEDNIPDFNVNDVCRSFEEAVTDVVITNIKRGMKQAGMNKIALAGGVAANSMLRAKMQKLGESENVKFYCPSPIICTDNAAMIGCAAYYDYLDGKVAGLDINAVANLSL